MKKPLYVFKDISDGDYLLEGFHSFEQWNDLTNKIDDPDIAPIVRTSDSLMFGDKFTISEKAFSGWMAYFPDRDLSTIIYRIDEHEALIPMFNKIWTKLIYEL